MKASIDQSGCIACGLCEELCPAVFAMSDAGPAEVISETVPADAEDASEGSGGKLPDRSDYGGVNSLLD